MKETNVYKENYEMRKKIERMQEAFSEITAKIYCVGGPLNDNIHGYTNKQLKIFSDIAMICRGQED